MTDRASSAAAIVAWLHQQPECAVEEGLSERELNRAEHHFAIRFPPVWRAVLSHGHPVAFADAAPSEDGVPRQAVYPDWRLRDDAATRDLLAAPATGLLFDVEHNDFWWADWGARPDGVRARLDRATDRLATVPRLVPLWGHLFVAASDDSPVFSIVQADLYIPAVTVADLPTGRDQGSVPLDEWPIGHVPFWSELHAYAQLGHQGPFAHLGTGGL